MLSGFVLTWSTAERTISKRDFYARRFARIYPAHLITWAAVLLLAAGGVMAGASVGTAFLNLLLLHAWTPGIEHYFSVNGPSWSISTEAFFYAMFPWLLPLIGGRHLARWFVSASWSTC